MTPLFIIPARGGSKGIPRKNIKEMCGRPLIAYTIDAAKEAQRALGGYILLSTEDKEIADTARRCGLDVDYMRPDSLAGDKAGSRECIIDAMDWADRQGISYDCVILLQPTSPLRECRDILDCTEKYSPEIDMAVSVTEASDNPYFNMFETDADGFLHISKGDGKYTARQQVPKVWLYNGAVYVINPVSIRRMPLGEFPRRTAYEMPRERSLDLDTPLDWLITETIMKNKLEEKGSKQL